MELYNSLTRKVEKVTASDGKVIRVYSCGPTVYDRAHIGNLASFIYADTLRRTLSASGMQVRHVMNLTDVDDKTIGRSQDAYPDLEPMEALLKLTQQYEDLFLKDLRAVGVDVDAITFVRATDNIPGMQDLIRRLLNAGIAYTADDGIYFSIEAYKKHGKRYGQLVDITAESTGAARVKNDEYDKENIHDFALWKMRKAGEPSWDFDVKGTNVAGRPGWHIECSAMSEEALGLPFDIHTGGIDLKFPHHENEIAQSTAISDQDKMAHIFMHSEHMLINAQKMSKSLNNFITLEDITSKGIDPLAFRLFVLEGHYRKQRNFTDETLQAAANRLSRWRQVSATWKAVADTERSQSTPIAAGSSDIVSRLQSDLNSPEALSRVDGEIDEIESHAVQAEAASLWDGLLQQIEQLFALKLTERSDEIDKLVAEREIARQNKDWARSDEIRETLKAQGIGINDTDNGPIWYRI